MSKSNPIELNFELHRKQGLVLTSKATEILYGGAAGGGKSHLTRIASIIWAMEIPGLQIFLFRRLYDDLIKNHVEGPTGFRMLLAPWINTRHPLSKLTGGRLAEVVEGEIRFWNGSKIFLCHLQHQKDLIKYQGPEIHVLILEEATQFTEYMIRFLRSRLRYPDALKIPDKYLLPKSEWKDANKASYVFPRALYTTNPGGIGHLYFKRNFVKAATPLQYHYAPKDDGSHLRQFIPAKVDDNPSVNVEEVRQNLQGLPKALQDAMLNGNWDAVIGAYFPEIETSKHFIPPFSIPAYWPRFMSMDWGACGDGDPFVIHWWAVSDGSVPNIPREALVCYREWSGAGLPKITVGQIITGVKQREVKDPAITYRVAGGDILEKRGTGPSVFELFRAEDIYFKRADMRRVSGWMQIRERLVGKKEEPMVYFFNTCVDTLESLNSLQCDSNDPNDCAPGNDHAADSVRYALMSRPWIREAPTKTVSWEDAKRPTLEQLFKERERLVRSTERT